MAPTIEKMERRLREVATGVEVEVPSYVDDLAATILDWHGYWNIARLREEVKMAMAEVAEEDQIPLEESKWEMITFGVGKRWKEGEMLKWLGVIFDEKLIFKRPEGVEEGDGASTAASLEEGSWRGRGAGSEGVNAVCGVEDVETVLDGVQARAIIWEVEVPSELAELCTGDFGVRSRSSEREEEARNLGEVLRGGEKISWGEGCEKVEVEIAVRLGRKKGEREEWETSVEEARRGRVILFSDGSKIEDSKMGAGASAKTKKSPMRLEHRAHRARTGEHVATRSRRVRHVASYHTWIALRNR
ncbi:hypothetical protein BDZ91DRAFT_802702 [Kalaharituber pfeilii]|nr:hypothetical protein BDZ91DRAFT_802702 [Kalaharituber pfeilii]